MMQHRITVPTRARRGAIIDLKIAILHPMETGFRVDDLGRKVPRNVIHHLSCRYNGEEVFTVDMGSGIAAMPILQCQAVAADSGEFVFAWEDEAGERDEARFPITVDA